MAYKGTTAGSSVGGANPPIRINTGMGGYVNTASTAQPVGMGLWFYGTTDTSTAPFTSGYFSDGYQLGMKQGDVMIVSALMSTVSSSQQLYIGIVSSVSSTGGGTQLSTMSFISST
jgi:hypothetical protein